MTARVPRNTISRDAVVLMLTAAILAVAACKRSDESGVSRAGDGVTHHSDANTAIRTTDGTMMLGVAGDTVYMGLTDSVLTAARKDMASDTEETSNAFARTVERLVKKSVSSALHSRLKYPLADLDSATSSGGTIRFYYRNRRRIAFEDVSQNGHKALQNFSPDDAQRFVVTVNSAIRTVRGATP